jgi:hypothetical protein
MGKVWHVAILVVGHGSRWHRSGSYRTLRLAAAVGDITPGIPKYPFIVTNIYIKYHFNILYTGGSGGGKAR